MQYINRFINNKEVDVQLLVYCEQKLKIKHKNNFYVQDVMYEYNRQIKTHYKSLPKLSRKEIGELLELHK